MRPRVRVCRATGCRALMSPGRVQDGIGERQATDATMEALRASRWLHDRSRHPCRMWRWGRLAPGGYPCTAVNAAARGSERAACGAGRLPVRPGKLGAAERDPVLLRLRLDGTYQQPLLLREGVSSGWIHRVRQPRLRLRPLR